MKIMVEKFNIAEQEIIDKVTDLQMTSFDAANVADDAKLDLEPADGPAELDQYAIGRIDFYKSGVKLSDEQQIFRTKFKLGTNEFFPEIDINVVGMKPGETKKIKIENGDHIDEAEFTLFGLRKEKPAAPKLEAVQPQEGTDGKAQQEEPPKTQA
jgi:FKBP-type peptidyl-prolyl cis-trans isomerase (trigger factor)